MLFLHIFLTGFQLHSKAETFFLRSEIQEDGRLGGPLPFNPYPKLTPIYMGSNSWFLIDDLEIAAARTLLSMESGDDAENSFSLMSASGAGIGGPLGVKFRHEFLRY